MKVPHSGYHWHSGADRFFEGWYYRITLPEVKQSFAFIYAIDDPQGGTKYSGGSMQVLGVDDQHIWRTLPNCRDFAANRESFDLSHWNSRGEGYTASDRHNQGKIYDPVQNLTCTWDYQIQAVSHDQTATMGWLSYLPVFAPGWQILRLHGLGSGFVNWGDRRYEFINAPVYMEKNWGGAFPEQWFWLQCNAFGDYGNLSVITAGGKRKTLGVSSDVAMVKIFYGGEIYSFMPENSEVYCEIMPWGSWQVRAYNSKGQRVEIIGKTEQKGTLVMVPTAAGLRFYCRDTALGRVRLTLEADGKSISAHSDQGAVEVGGAIWEELWRFKSARI